MTIKVKTYVHVKTDLFLEDGTRLGSITPIQTTIDDIKMTIVHMEFEKPLEPSDLPYVLEGIKSTMKYVEGDVVILSGRGPIWLFVAVAHAFHGIIQHVATFDPKLQGAVIVMGHSRKFSLGQVIKLPKDLLVQLVDVNPR